MNRYFIIAGGKTGGHLFPGIAVTEEILRLKQNLSPLFIGLKNGIEAKIIPKLGYELRFVNVSGFYGKSLYQRFISIIKLPISIIQGIYYILKYRPLFIIGLGGFGSFPLLVAAIICFRPFFILEQNISLGIVNKLLGRFARLFFMPRINHNLKWGNIKSLGNPIRKEICELANLALDKRREKEFKIFIFGGSQGASILNDTMLKTLYLIKNSALKVSIVHQTGKRDFAIVKKAYQKAGIKHFTVLEFIDNMAYHYLTSSLIICRAGSSVFELNAAGRVAILVPISNSSGNHQLNNSKLFVEKKAAWELLEIDLNFTNLFAKINYAYHNPTTLAEMEKNSKKMFQPGSATNIATACLKFLRHI
ncbi:MAG: UDP-N-acetylglucosamine--N-acetylmuramyl-(pentapeptide) pyrophosphoryl-undecaprenol N-acetylglucosamine transferase [SAR324 cluster bacterium]|nr:UDP-N-acetylglucosamine--N-acetylmuramyl-(pentapeptide) pyrophosphoryl-undecaprenol N-acetylglucosamine transferase [SAR324 cluster bacterium]